MILEASFTNQSLFRFLTVGQAKIILLHVQYAFHQINTSNRISMGAAKRIHAELVLLVKNN